jgi:hypothetical protein
MAPHEETGHRKGNGDMTAAHLLVWVLTLIFGGYGAFGFIWYFIDLFFFKKSDRHVFFGSLLMMVCAWFLAWVGGI